MADRVRLQIKVHIDLTDENLSSLSVENLNSRVEADFRDHLNALLDYPLQRSEAVIKRFDIKAHFEAVK